MQILEQSLTIDELRKVGAGDFGGMVKAVVDIQRELVAVDAELHSDLEALLLEGGSAQRDIWGINLYPDAEGDGFVEFDSMINMRPSHGNRSRGVDDAGTQKKIIEVVNKWIKK